MSIDTLGDTFSGSLNKLKESFLWAAAKGGNFQDCQSLLDIGANINWKGADGDTPLLAACRRGHTDTVALLIAHNADVNIPGNDSNFPIHVACERGDYDIVNFLLNTNKVLLDVINNHGMSPLDVAKSRKLKHIINRLTQPIASHSTRDEAIRKESNVRINSTRQSLAEESKDSSRQNSVNITPQLPMFPTIGRNDPSSQLKPNATNDYELKFNSSDSNLISSRKDSLPMLSIKDEKDCETTLLHSKMMPSHLPYDGPLHTFENSHEREERLHQRCLMLQKQLISEQQQRGVLTSKLNNLTHQHNTVVEDYANTQKKYDQLSALYEETKQTLALHQGDKVALKGCHSISKLEEIEISLRLALECVEYRKAQVVKDELENQKEQRLCVICQEKEKSVVLLPCRHMCICEDCSQGNLLQACPLCRRPIAHKISVFA